jgi:hypothetical protein
MEVIPDCPLLGPVMRCTKCLFLVQKCSKLSYCPRYVTSTDSSSVSKPCLEMSLIGYYSGGLLFSFLNLQHSNFYIICTVHSVISLSKTNQYTIILVRCLVWLKLAAFIFTDTPLCCTDCLSQHCFLYRTDIKRRNKLHICVTCPTYCNFFSLLIIKRNLRKSRSFSSHIWITQYLTASTYVQIFCKYFSSKLSIYCIKVKI